MKGRCLNRLTMGPFFSYTTPAPAFFGCHFNSPSRTRTYDSAVNSRVLYRLSYRGLSLLSLSGLSLHTLKTAYLPISLFLLPFHKPLPSRLSPRPISSSQLHTLLHFHLCPIYLVLFKGPYFSRMGYLVLRGASRLDAFSAYPFPAWLPCYSIDC